MVIRTICHTRAEEKVFILKNFTKEQASVLYQLLLQRGWLDGETGIQAFLNLFSQTGEGTATKVKWLGKKKTAQKYAVNIDGKRLFSTKEIDIPIYVIANLFNELESKQKIACPDGFHVRAILMAHMVDKDNNTFCRIDAQSNTRMGNEWRTEIEEIINYFF